MNFVLGYCISIVWLTSIGYSRLLLLSVLRINTLMVDDVMFLCFLAKIWPGRPIIIDYKKSRISYTFLDE